MKTNTAYKISGLAMALCLSGAVGASAAPATLDSTVPSAASTAPSVAGATVEPKDFIRQAYLANEFGILASQLALKNATSANAKQAAQQVLTDNMKVRQDMVAAIQQSTSDMHFDQSWDAHYKDMLAELKSTKGATFDRTYLNIQSNLTAQTAGMFGDYAKSGTDDAVKSFAANELPTLQADGDKLKASVPAGAFFKPS